MERKPKEELWKMTEEELLIYFYQLKDKCDELRELKEVTR